MRRTEELKRKYDLTISRSTNCRSSASANCKTTFDQIVCTGVLHHLADPDAGLRALRDVLKPDGAMHLMVYAPYGRAGIYMLQEFCRRIGISATDDEIRDLIAALGALPPAIRWHACCARPRTSGRKRRWPTLCCIRRTARIRCRSSWISFEAEG